MKLQGECLCGAVKVRAWPARAALSACHCDMCRRWTSSVFMAVPAEPGSVEISGPAKTIRTSDWAERAFCAECGSALWYHITADGPMHDQMQLAAGLFEDAAGSQLRLEPFIDRKPHGYAFDGERRQMTEAEVTAIYASSDDGGT